MVGARLWDHLGTTTTAFIIKPPWAAVCSQLGVFRYVISVVASVVGVIVGRRRHRRSSSSLSELQCCADFLPRRSFRGKVNDGTRELFLPTWPAPSLAGVPPFVEIRPASDPKHQLYSCLHVHVTPGPPNLRFFLICACHQCAICLC